MALGSGRALSKIAVVQLRQLYMQRQRGTIIAERGKRQKGEGRKETYRSILPFPLSRFPVPFWVGAAALAVTVLMTWPLASDLGRLGRTSNSGDARFSVWTIIWVAHALITDPADLFDANIYYPHRQTLAYSEANLVAGALAVPPWALTHNPHIAHNLVVLIALAGTVLTTWLLAKHLTGDAGAAASSAVLFAFSPFFFSHMPHIQLLMAAGMPLSLLMLHRLVDAPSVRTGIALGLALALQALSCAYYGIFVGLITGYGSLFYAWSRRCWTSRAYWLAILIAAVVSIAIVTPFFIPYLDLQRESGFVRSLSDSEAYSAYVRSYLASASHAHSWMLPLIKTWNGEVLFPGFMAIALGSIGLTSALRRRQHSADSPIRHRDRETALFYGSMGVLAFWISLGPRAALYTLLYHTIPIFSFLRAPGRTGILVALVLALFVAFAIRDARARFSRRARSIAAGACLLALVELNGVPIDWRPVRRVPRSYEVLAGVPRGVLAEFPFYERRTDFYLHTEYMLNSTVHWLPLVNGYSDYIPPDFRELAVTLASFPSRESFEALKRRRVRYVTVHRDLYGRERAAEIEARLQEYRRYLRPLAADDQMLVFEVMAWPE
jgi:hypothetical protein